MRRRCHGLGARRRGRRVGAPAGRRRRRARRIDVLVNNAGLYAGLRRGAFDELDEGEWDRVMAVNVKGTVAVRVAPACR